MKEELVITSAANPTIKWVRSLAQRKYRDAEGCFILEGARDIRAALDAGWSLRMVLACPGEPLSFLPSQVKVLRVSVDLMARVAGRENPQDTMAVVESMWAPQATMGKKGIWLGLENIRDPGNLGTIIRTADAVAAAGIILIGDTCDPFSPEAVRATMGSLPRVPLVKITRDDFVAWAKSGEALVLGTHLQGSVDYRSVDYDRPSLVVLMGSESQGLSDALVAVCQQKLRIPMPGHTESLNLGVASALMLYEAARHKL